MIVLLVLFYGHSNAMNEEREEFTFVLLSENQALVSIVNKERANERFSPFSTFKIPNSLIAIENQLVASPTQPLAFDKDQYPIQNWWPSIWYQAPLVIRDAFQHSAVPIYQQLAVGIGEQRMRQALEDFGYGNKDITSGLDTFWLNGSLQISAMEQVLFLQKLFKQKLSITQHTYDAFLQVMCVETTEKQTLYAKTGGGGIGDGEYLGWYVGIVQTDDDVFYFATNVSGGSFSEVQTTRIEISMRELQRNGIVFNGK